jgi:hypothetical protein
MVLLAPLLSPGGVLAESGAACLVPVESTRARPDPEGVPTEVLVGIYLVDLRAIDDSRQAFNADVVVSLRWEDSRLAGKLLAGCRVALDSLWHPRILIVNERSVTKREPDLVTIAGDGTLRYAQRYSGDFTVPLLLEDFPFDKHDLSIALLSAGYSPGEVVLRIDPERTGRMERLSIAEWSVGSAEVTSEPLHLKAMGRSLSQIVFQLEAERELGFYLWKVLVPLTFIVFMSWAVFWMDPKVLPPQIGVATSAVLTLIAFQFSLGYLLPRLSYLTRADRFLLGSTVLVFLAFGEAVLTGYLAARGQETRAKKLDRAARVLFPLGYIAVISLSFWL